MKTIQDLALEACKGHSKTPRCIPSNSKNTKCDIKSWKDNYILQMVGDMGYDKITNRPWKEHKNRVLYSLYQRSREMAKLTVDNLDINEPVWKIAELLYKNPSRFTILNANLKDYERFYQDWKKSVIVDKKTGQKFVIQGNICGTLWGDVNTSLLFPTCFTDDERSFMVYMLVNFKRNFYTLMADNLRDAEKKRKAKFRDELSKLYQDE